MVNLEVPHLEVLARVVPAEFRGLDYSVVRNNVYRSTSAADGTQVRSLVGQLQEVGRFAMVEDQARPLFGLGSAANALSAVGAFASIANLGVSVVGFHLVRQDLRRIESRLGYLQGSVDRLDLSVSFLHEKVDYLGLLSEEILLEQAKQRESLSQVRTFLLAGLTAELGQALETLEVRSQQTTRNHAWENDVREAAKTLQRHRLLLVEFACRPASTLSPATQVEAGLALAACARAECRSWLMLGEYDFALRAVDHAMGTIRSVAQGLYSADGCRPWADIEQQARLQSWLFDWSIDDSLAECARRLVSDRLAATKIVSAEKEPSKVLRQAVTVFGVELVKSHIETVPARDVQFANLVAVISAMAKEVDARKWAEFRLAADALPHVLGHYRELLATLEQFGFATMLQTGGCSTLHSCWNSLRELRDGTRVRGLLQEHFPNAYDWRDKDGLVLELLGPANVEDQS